MNIENWIPQPVVDAIGDAACCSKMSPNVPILHKTIIQPTNSRRSRQGNPHLGRGSKNGMCSQTSAKPHPMPSERPIAEVRLASDRNTERK